MKPKFIKLRNFKSIGSDAQTIELAPITLLFGQNSAGKSTVLQSLIYLREILVHQNYNPDKTSLGGDWLDLGGFQNLIHGHNLNEAIELSIGFELDGDALSDYLSDHERDEIEAATLNLPEEWLNEVKTISINIKIRWNESRKRPFIETYESWIDEQLLAKITSTPDGRQVYIEELDTTHLAFSRAMPYSVVGASELTFHEQLSEMLSTVTMSQASRTFDSLLSNDRPFARDTIDHLEELYLGAAKKEPLLLNKIAEELKRRTSRRASELSKNILAEIATTDIRGKFGFLSLIGQVDALPIPELGIKMDRSVWQEENDEFKLDSEFRLLSESLISAFTAGPIKLIHNWLDTFSYIGPIRDLPARNLEPQRTPEKSRWSKGLAAWEFLHQATDNQLAEINHWLGEDCLNTGYQAVVYRYRELAIDNPLLNYLDREMEIDDQLRIKESIEDLPIRTRVTLREQDTGLDVMPQDIGVGISQLFPVVVLTVTQSSGLIAIEQPELHVHPAIQVELADLFARYAIEHNKLMLLETHSEHLMLRLLRRIREVDDEKIEAQHLNKESVSVIYVQPTSDGTKFKRLYIDDAGDFVDEWPQGFFDERDRELFF
jgi:hypothetical protein